MTNLQGVKKRGKSPCTHTYVAFKKDRTFIKISVKLIEFAVDITFANCDFCRPSYKKSKKKFFFLVLSKTSLKWLGLESQLLCWQNLSFPNHNRSFWILLCVDEISCFEMKWLLDLICRGPKAYHFQSKKQNAEMHTDSVDYFHVPLYYRLWQKSKKLYHTLG